MPYSEALDPRNSARPDSTPLLATIDVPTLVLVGTEDALTSPSDAEAMFNTIPGCRIAQISGAGHLSDMESPKVFNTQIAEFLTPRQTFEVGGGGKW